VTRPFDAYLRLKEDPDTDLSEFLAHHADSDVEARAAAEQLIRGLAEHFDFTWANDVTLFRDMLKRVLSRVPQGCRLVIIQPPLRGRFNGEKTDPRTVNIREATSATLPAFPFAREIDIESCVANEGEVCEGWHFDRMVYFRLFQAAEALLRNEGRSWPIKARQH
jgi:hypothetical protein